MCYVYVTGYGEAKLYEAPQGNLILLCKTPIKEYAEQRLKDYKKEFEDHVDNGKNKRNHQRHTQKPNEV